MDVFGVGLPELIVIFVVALLVFGPRKLPEISKTIAKTLKGLQDASRDFQTAFYQEAEELERTTRSESVKSKSTSKPSSARRSSAQSTAAQSTDSQASPTDTDASPEVSMEPTSETGGTETDQDAVADDLQPPPESQEDTETIAAADPETPEAETVADLKQDTPETVAAETSSSTPESSQISAA